MSVYNGFGTRQQESEYNKTLYKSAFLLQLKITKDLKGEKFDDHAFMKHFCKLYHKLFLMEQYKYLPPKFSYALKELAEYYGVFAKIDKNSLSSNSSHLSFKNLGKTAKMHPQDAIYEKDEPIDQEYLHVPDQPYSSPFRSKPRHPSRYPEASPQQYQYSVPHKKRSKGSRVQTRRLTNTRGSGATQHSGQNIVSMPGKPVPPLFMPPINGKDHSQEKQERMIESPRSSKHPSVPNQTAKFARKDVTSPNTTINNNNIIININKSYNMKSEETQDEPKPAKEDSPPQKEHGRDVSVKEDELNENRMKESMLEELEESDKNKTEKNQLSTSDFTHPPKVRAGNIFSKRSLSPKNSRTVSPLEKQPLKNKFSGTSPISRAQLSSLPDSYNGYRMTPVGRGTQLEPIQRNANYQQQVQMSLRKQSRTGGSHYNQRNYSNHPDYAYQQQPLYQDMRSESPGKRLSDYGNVTQTLGSRVKRKQAHYVPAAVSFDGIRNDFEKNFSKMRIKKYGYV